MSTSRKISKRLRNRDVFDGAFVVKCFTLVVPHQPSVFRDPDTLPRFTAVHFRLEFFHPAARLERAPKLGPAARLDVPVVGVAIHGGEQFGFGVVAVQFDEGGVDPQLGAVGTRAVNALAGIVENVAVLFFGGAGAFLHRLERAD